jgi:DNA-directed RNA polymerase subunit omega
MLPKPDILNNYEHGKFVLSNLAAKRAKQLKEGAPPLVQVDSVHPLTIALAEIAAGKIKPIMVTAAELGVQDSEISTVLLEDTVPSELGMLLPALDEAEVSLVAVVGEEDADHVEAEHDAEVSLADLAHDEEEEAVPAEDDTLSLTEIAEQETAEEEPEES